MSFFFITSCDKDDPTPYFYLVVDNLSGEAVYTYRSEDGPDGPFLFLGKADIGPTQYELPFEYNNGYWVEIRKLDDTIVNSEFFFRDGGDDGELYFVVVNW